MLALSAQAAHHAAGGCHCAPECASQASIKHVRQACALHGVQFCLPPPLQVVAWPKPPQARTNGLQLVEHGQHHVCISCRYLLLMLAFLYAGLFMAHAVHMANDGSYV